MTLTLLPVAALVAMPWVAQPSQPTASGAPAAAGAMPTRYPHSKRGDVVDVYHGETIADPYRWLEDDNAEDTKQWVIEQNTVTEAFLSAIPQREAIRTRLTEIWNYERYTLPFEKGGHYFYRRNNGLQPQSVLYVTHDLKDPGVVLLDPNTLKADGTAALSGTSVSHDGMLLAYSIADSGSDWNIWRVRDVETGKDLPDELRWIKFSGVSWTKDNKGFFYTRFDEPAPGTMLTSLNENPKVYYHRLGQSQSDDQFIYNRPDHPRWSVGGGVSDDGRYLIMYVSQGSSRKNMLLYRDLTTHPLSMKPTEADTALATLKDESGRAALIAKNGGVDRGFVELIGDFNGSFDFVDNEGSTFIIATDDGAPRGRVIAIDVTKPGREHWKELVPQQSWTQTSVSRVGSKLVVEYLKDAASYVRVHDLTGKHLYDVNLPGVGSAGGFATKRESSRTFYSYTSYTQPPTIYAFDVDSRAQTVFKEAKVKFDPSKYETRLVFSTSEDGTKVPVFITCRKDLALNGRNPCILYGYGGFSVSMQPGFSPVVVQWLELGGIYAVACIRGGGEYGDEWHQAAVKTKRPVAHNDFISAAEFLIKNDYTTPAKLAIRGGSNGGLLVGAVMCQRPDLFGAAIPEVGVMDMLRFHTFTIGHAWRTDYGSSENADEFKVLNYYSPYHRLLRDAMNSRGAMHYPATLVTTADHDDRVVPGHSFKFAAALQAAGAPSGEIDPSMPLLIRVDVSAGHGAGKPTKKAIDANTDVLAFLVKTLGMDE